MDKLVALIKEKMTVDGFVGNTFPALTNWGVTDQDVMIHSLGVSCWNCLGYNLDLMAVVECPSPFSGIAGDDIRSDSVWFDKKTKQPVAVIEFERYDGSENGQKKLLEKAENLLESNKRWGGAPQILILSAWSIGMVKAPDYHFFSGIIRNGFKNRKGSRVKGNTEVKFLFSRFCFQPMTGKKLYLDQIFFEGSV